MKIYQNTFEIFGDTGRCEAESKREFALAYLPMFVLESDPPQPGRFYRIDELDHSERVGMSNEIRWFDRVYDACIHKQAYEWDSEKWSGLIDEESLLDFLEEAVEEV